MEEFKKEHLQELQTILNLTQAGKAEVAIINNFVNKFIDPTAHCCHTCSAQIRFYHKRVTDWASVNAALIESVKKDEFADKLQCECGAEVPDARYKRCADCTREYKKLRNKK
jgi:hypothetical protein